MRLTEKYKGIRMDEYYCDYTEELDKLSMDLSEFNYYHNTNK